MTIKVHLKNLTQMIQKIKIQNQEFHLHPLGGLFWEEKSLLLISDVHLGKVSHFRKFGAAVPRKAIHQNFLLLDKIVSDFQPFQICFLGDLFHSSLNKEWELFENWVAKTPTEILLVTGNHDIIAPEKFEKLKISIFPELIIDSFLLTHHPEERESHFTFCGHVHPSIKLKGIGKDRLKLPCFFKSENQMILPAFGQFTGTHSLDPKKSDEVYAIAEDSIFKV